MPARHYRLPCLLGAALGISMVGEDDAVRLSAQPGNERLQHGPLIARQVCADDVAGPDQARQ
jgi:hypothetical protein